MTSLPSGTVTFLFTDVEGSTKLAQQYPDDMPGMLAKHHEILTESIQAHDGFVFQSVGDSFCAAFHSAADALGAALDAQRCLFGEAWARGAIKVRMGIHTGAAQVADDGQYSGYTTLALTQRIMAAGHGGQVLLSGAARELVRDSLPEGTDLIDLGEKRLKDLLRPEHLYQLNIFGLPAVFPSLKTLDAFPNNLPIQLTTFIGREKEITEIKQDLAQHRLVTLTGSGGTGKTRLSLQVAAELLEKFDHGVWFVELAPLADPDLIPRTVLSTIGIVEQRGKTSLQVLKEYVQDKKILILLDNCEHLIEASAGLVNVLLSAAPGLRILASSREALGVRGEASYSVPSLALPDIKNLPLVEQTSQYEAVRLFIDRASLVAPHFAVDKNNAPFIAQICYRLDGIPLAIELAAARVKVLSVEQISLRLDDRFRLLTGGSRTALPRQQTLRALIDWSYDILTSNEKTLLRRLSVFASGWTLEAAEDVCSGEGIETYDVLDLLTQLVNKSLVILIEHTVSGETRYRMLETIRQYGGEKLLASGDSERIHDRHLAYFVKLAERAEQELYRTNQTYWFHKLDDDYDNLRMALEWALSTNAGSGLQIIYRLRHFWEAYGVLREVSGMLAQFLESYEAMDALRARSMAVYSFSLFRQGNFPEAIRIAEQSLQMARSLADRHTEAFSLCFLGLFTLTQGNVREGAILLEQSLALYQELDDQVNQAIVMEWLAVNGTNRERGVEYAMKSLKIYRELGSSADIMSNLCQLARVTIWQGDLSSAVPWLEEALSLSRQLGNRPNQADALATYGNLLYWQGNYQRACDYFEEAIKLCEEIGNHFEILWIRIHIAYATLRTGNVQQARLLFTQAIHDTRKADIQIAQIFAVEGVASLQVSLGNFELAARLLAWADAIRDEIGDYRPLVEQRSVERDREMIRAQLDQAAFHRTWQQGKAMAFEEAVACALDGSHE